MRCQRCHQHNSPQREACWNCGTRLKPPATQDASGDGEPQVASSSGSEPDDVCELGTLGPLRLADGSGQPRPPVVRRQPAERQESARRMRRLLIRGIVAGALTGGVILAFVFSLLASAAAGILEAGGIARGARLVVYVVQGFTMGAANGAIIGALTAYYGGGWWTGAKAGAALAAGTGLAQALITGAIVEAPAYTTAAALLVLAAAGAAMGALVGAVIEALSPTD